MNILECSCYDAKHILENGSCYYTSVTFSRWVSYLLQQNVHMFHFFLCPETAETETKYTASSCRKGLLYPFPQLNASMVPNLNRQYLGFLCEPRRHFLGCYLVSSRPLFHSNMHTAWKTDVTGQKASLKVLAKFKGLHFLFDVDKNSTSYLMLTKDICLLGNSCCSGCATGEGDCY